MRARPTTYKGVQMRSRLEARFAALLDEREVTWEYEPMCFADEDGQYLPDFYLPFYDEYVEVKPAASPGCINHNQLVEFRRRMEIILASEPAASLTVYYPELVTACSRPGGSVYWTYTYPHWSGMTEVQMPRSDDGRPLLGPLGSFPGAVRS